MSNYRGKKSQIKLMPPDGLRYVSDEKPVNLTSHLASNLYLSLSLSFAPCFSLSLSPSRPSLVRSISAWIAVDDTFYFVGFANFIEGTVDSIVSLIKDNDLSPPPSKTWLYPFTHLYPRQAGTKLNFANKSLHELASRKED